MRFSSIFQAFTSRESGATLIETVVVLAILGTIAVCFLSGSVTSSKAAFTMDERATAESLARSQIELVKSASYSYNATGYSLVPIPSSKDYINYSVNITTAPLNSPDDGIQKITVTVTRSGERVITLESYKVDR
ncbi:type II secretion system protein [Chloroflexota bacterium]